MNHTDGSGGLGEEGREHWGGVLMEGYRKVSIWGYVWLFSERFIWMLNQELAVGIPGGRTYTQAKEGMEKDCLIMSAHTVVQKEHIYIPIFLISFSYPYFL